MRGRHGPCYIGETVSRDIHRAPTAEDVSDDQATTQVRRRPDTGHPLERYIAWLERIAENLSSAGASGHLMTCEKLIADLRKTIRAEARAPVSPLQPEIHQCLGGMRSILRAVRAGELALDPELRRDLVELVSEITESVLAHDLGGEPR